MNNNNSLSFPTTGDMIAYEFTDQDGAWLWSLGRVLAYAHPRVMNVEVWAPQQKKNLSAEDKKKASEMMTKIANKQQKLAEERSSIQRLVAEATLKSQEVQERYEKCESELADVMPVLEEAKRALSGISVKELREIKAYKQPPTTVKLVMEAVLTAIGVGNKAAEWDFVKTFIVDVGFIPKVKYFDPIEMTAVSLAKIREISQNPDFTYDRAQRASKAAGPLQKWVTAQLQYIDAIPEHLKPLLDEARQLKASLRELEEQKRKGEADVALIESDVKKLQQMYNDMLYGDGVRAGYENDGTVCLTQAIPSGTWTPADRKKIHVVRSSSLCILMSPGTSPINEFTFTREIAEQVKASVNVNGELILTGEFKAPKKISHMSTLEEVGLGYAKLKKAAGRASSSKKGRRGSTSGSPAAEAETASGASSSNRRTPSSLGKKGKKSSDLGGRKVPTPPPNPPPLPRPAASSLPPVKSPRIPGAESASSSLNLPSAAASSNNSGGPPISSARKHHVPPLAPPTSSVTKDGGPPHLPQITPRGKATPR